MSSTTETWRSLLRDQPVLPAPMCGISDFAFRSICRDYGGPLAYRLGKVSLSRFVSDGPKSAFGESVERD